MLQLHSSLWELSRIWKKCKSCKRKNHFEICCPRKEVKAVAEQVDDSYSEVSQSSDSCDDDCFIDSINEERSSNSASSKNISSVDDGKSDWSVALEMNGKDTTFKSDTGAQCNVISKNLLKSLSPCPKLKPATVKLSAYNGTEVPIAGKCITSIKHKNQTVNVLFIVVETDSVPILGVNTSEKLNLIKRIYKSMVILNQMFPIKKNCLIVLEKLVVCNVPTTLRLEIMSNQLLLLYEKFHLLSSQNSKTSCSV